MCHFLPVYHLGIAFLGRVEGQNITMGWLDNLLAVFEEKSWIVVFTRIKVEKQLIIFNEPFYLIFYSTRLSLYIGFQAAILAGKGILFVLKIMHLNLLRSGPGKHCNVESNLIRPTAIGAEAAILLREKQQSKTARESLFIFLSSRYISLQMGAELIVLYFFLSSFSIN